MVSPEEDRARQSGEDPEEGTRRSRPSAPDRQEPRTRPSLGKVTQALFDISQVLAGEGAKLEHGAAGAEVVEPQRRREAEACRHAGNRLYRLRRYRDAAAKYSEGLLLDPDEHRLWCYRAACRAALKDWQGCWDDAQHATQLEPTFVKGWQLLAKALWKEDMPVMAKQVLAEGLHILPGSPELLELNTMIDRHRCLPKPTPAPTPVPAPRRVRQIRTDALEVEVPPVPHAAAHDAAPHQGEGKGKQRPELTSPSGTERAASPSALRVSPTFCSASKPCSPTPVEPLATPATSTTPGSSRTSPYPTGSSGASSGRCFPRPPKHVGGHEVAAPPSTASTEPPPSAASSAGSGRSQSCGGSTRGPGRTTPAGICAHANSVAFVGSPPKAARGFEFDFSVPKARGLARSSSQGAALHVEGAGLIKR